MFFDDLYILVRFSVIFLSVICLSLFSCKKKKKTTSNHTEEESDMTSESDAQPASKRVVKKNFDEENEVRKRKREAALNFKLTEYKKKPNPADDANKPNELAPRPPAVGGMAGTHDPNYQTLAAVGGDCFGADKGAASQPKPPAQAGMVGTNDPNYQTLAGLGQDCFGADKVAGGVGGEAQPKPPAVGGMAGTFDPNYQTLAAVNGDCFAK